MGLIIQLHINCLSLIVCRDTGTNQKIALSTLYFIAQEATQLSGSEVFCSLKFVNIVNKTTRLPLN